MSPAPMWLDLLTHVAWVLGLLLTGTGIHYTIYSIDQAYGDGRVPWTRGGRAQGVVVRVPRPKPAPRRPSRWSCWWTGRHPNATRHPAIGGFRCPDCGAAGASLHDMGFKGGGYIRPRYTRHD